MTGFPVGYGEQQSSAIGDTGETSQDSGELDTGCWMFQEHHGYLGLFGLKSI